MAQTALYTSISWTVHKSYNKLYSIATYQDVVDFCMPSILRTFVAQLVVNLLWWLKTRRRTKAHNGIESTVQCMSSILSCASDVVLPLRPVSLAWCPTIGSSTRKVFPGRQFTGKNPPRLAAARAGQIFTGKLSGEERLFWGAIL